MARWIQKCEIDETNLPIPTQIVSNEEFAPPDSTHTLDYLVANCAEEGRYTEAVKYAQMLADVPSDDDRLKSTGLGYLGIARAYNKAGNKQRSDEFYRRFLSAWRDADKDLPQMKEAAK